MLRALLLFIGILLLTLIYKYQTNRESFKPLSPSENIYANDDGLLLKGYYRIKEQPGISSHNSTDTLRLYSKTSMSDYSQKTNNKRHWFTPCNGSSIRSDMCGGLYKGKALKKPNVSSPSMSSARVNMFDSLEY